LAPKPVWTFRRIEILVLKEIDTFVTEFEAFLQHRVSNPNHHLELSDILKCISKQQVFVEGRHDTERERERFCLDLCVLDIKVFFR
jgi:hypothetical protein